MVSLAGDTAVNELSSDDSPVGTLLRPHKVMMKLPVGGEANVRKIINVMSSQAKPNKNTFVCGVHNTCQ